LNTEKVKVSQASDKAVSVQLKFAFWT
jgi:hypothetical protein